MSYHILHLLSHSLKVRIKLDQLHITDMDSGTDKSVPLADVAVIVCAARDTEFSASSLRRMAELNVLLLVCNEKFEPCAITLPYYRATNTELLRRQIEWTPEWKTQMWRQIITAKVRNQAANLAHLKRAHSVLKRNCGAVRESCFGSSRRKEAPIKCRQSISEPRYLGRYQREDAVPRHPHRLQTRRVSFRYSGRLRIPRGTTLLETSVAAFERVAGDG